MKRLVLTVISVMLLMVHFPVMAQDMNATDGVRRQEGCVPGKKMMGMGMMGMMAPREMVASGDGVIVLVGNKLQKYDKDLNLVKEVEVKIDVSGIKKMMMENCPMMQQQGQSGPSSQ